MWIAEKFQSNSEIAGSPRNSFRASLKVKTHGGRALNDGGVIGTTKVYQTANAIELSLGVRLHEISWVVKRERAQTNS